MKIADGKLYRFELLLRRPLPSDPDQTSRAGLIVRLRSESGESAFGEIAPLPGYSREILEEATTETRAVLHRLIGSEVPQHLEELSGGFNAWMGDVARLPSVRFGFESAVLNLLAARAGLPVERILSDKPGSYIAVNGLLAGEPAETLQRATALVAEGYRTLKLKVGRMPIDTEIELIAELRRSVGPEIRLRLDANRRLAHHEAVRLLTGVEPFDIEYVEEPVDCLGSFKALLNTERPSVPLALDESLLDFNPEDLAGLAGVRAVVLKPTILGLERTTMFARVALAREIVPVISSAFETSVGMTVLARLAATLPDDGAAMGLDTLQWLSDDLLAPPLSVRTGSINLSDLPDIADTLRRELLSEVVNG